MHKRNNAERVIRCVMKKTIGEKVTIFGKIFQRGNLGLTALV